MELSFQLEQQEDVLVIAVIGDLKLGPKLRHSAEMLRQASHVKGFLVDLTACTNVDSAGLGELLRWFNVARRNQQGICLTGLSNSFRQMMRVARVDAILPVMPDRASALELVRG